MARYANPFYNGGAVAADPMAGIGASLATALFGNPQLAAQQQLQQSQIRENEAQARNADSTADARNLPIKAQGGLADAVVNYVTSLHQPPSVPHGTFSPPAGAGGDTITVPPGFEGVAGAIANALPAETGGPAPSLVPAGGAVAPNLPVATAAPESTTSPEAMGALAQLIQLGIQSGQGEHLPALLDLVDAHAGNDETARRGMVGAGHTPGADFALTPDRADAIALARADSGANAMAREQVQSADRRFGDNLAHSDRRYSTDVAAATGRRGQDIGARTTERGQDISADTARNTYPTRGERNNNPGNIEDGPFARSQPGYAGSDGRFARFNSNDAGVAAQENLLRHNYSGLTVRQIIERYSPPRRLGGDNPDEAVENSIRYSAGRMGVSADTVPTGSQFADLAASMRDTENGHQDRGRGGRTNSANSATRTAASGRAPPRGRVVNQRNQDLVVSELDTALGERKDGLTPEAYAALRARAVSNFGMSGSAPQAASDAIAQMIAIGRRNLASNRTAAASPAPAARPSGGRRPTVIRYDAQGNRVG